MRRGSPAVVDRNAVSPSDFEVLASLAGASRARLVEVAGEDLDPRRVLSAGPVLERQPELVQDRPTLSHLPARLVEVTPVGRVHRQAL